MAAIAVFSDQNMRRGLRKVRSPLSQAVGQGAECPDLFSHAILGGLLQDVADLAFQGATVFSGTTFQPSDGFVIQRRICTVAISSFPAI